MKKNFPYTYITVNFCGSNISGLYKTTLFSQNILFEHHFFCEVMTKTRRDQNIFINRHETE